MKLLGALTAVMLAASSATEPSPESIIIESLSGTGGIERLIDRGLEGINPHARGSGDVTLLIAVARGLDIVSKPRQSEVPTLLRSLIDRGADVNATDAFGHSALHEVCGSRSSVDTEAVRVLLDAGANSDLADRKGITALMRAAQTRDATLAFVLIQRGASVDVSDRDGRTALHHAASLAQSPVSTEVFRVLHDAGADVNARDRFGWTPLMCAAQGGDAMSIMTLVGVGADPNARDDRGWTPVLIAAGSNNFEIWKDWIVNIYELSRENPDSVNMHAATAANYADSYGPSSRLWYLLRWGKATLDVELADGRTIDDLLKGRDDPESRLMREIVSMARQTDVTRPLFDELPKKQEQ